MPNLTTNYNLPTPSGNDSFKGHRDLKTLGDAIDSLIKTQETVLLNSLSMQKYYLSVKEFGAKGDGIADDTSALKDAINTAVSSRRTLFLPRGEYRVTSTLPFPNYIKMFGASNGCSIVADFPTSGSWIFEETVDTYRWDLQDITFVIKSGATKDVGVLKTQNSLRYATLKNIRVFDYKRGFYLGSGVYGILSVDKVGIYYLSGTDAQTALEIRGNTVMMSDLEIIGGFSKGLYMVGASVFKLDGYNIAGTPGAMMKSPIHIETSKAGSIDSGWIEQLDETGLANGEAKAMYFKDSTDIKVTSALLATGSIWVDGGDLTIENIEYAQINAGVRYQNGARITASKTGLKRQNVSLRVDWADGIIEVYDIPKNTKNLLSNPLLRKGILNNFSASNASVTLSDSTDKLSGERSIQIASTSNFQGARLDLTNLVSGKTYSLRAKVKKMTGVDYVTIAPLSGSTASIDLPSILAQNKRSDYHDVSYIFVASASTASLRVQMVFATGATSGTFLLDSIGLFEGYSEQDTSQLLPDKMVASVKPYEGQWNVGEMVYNVAPASGNYLGWICTSSGTPGTWKGFGMIEA